MMGFLKYAILIPLNWTKYMYVGLVYYKKVTNKTQ